MNLFYQAGEGVTIPSDPVVGCECEDCGSSKSCCPRQMNTVVVFNKLGRIKVIKWSVLLIACGLLVILVILISGYSYYIQDITLD